MVKKATGPITDNLSLLKMDKEIEIETMEEKKRKLAAVDTVAERTALEYHPTVKYEPNKPITVNLPAEQVFAEKQDSIQNNREIDNDLEEATQQYNRFVTLQAELDDVIHYVEQELSDIKIPISEAEVAKILQSFPSIDRSF